MSTHSASPFRHRLIVSRVLEHVRFNLIDNHLTIRRRNAATEHRILDADGFEQCLGEDFG
jgi:arylamine N-acetyltransferase